MQLWQVCRDAPEFATERTIALVNGYLADAVDGLFEKALGQSEEKTLTDVVEILSGGTPKTKISEYWEDGEIPFFGPGDANGSTYCLTTAKHITQLGLENCSSELYPVDTVFLTARGTVGKVAMAGKPMAMNQSCFAFRGLGVSQPAVYQIIKRAVRSLKVKANGATFAAINTRDLKIEAILVPSDEELTAFEEEAASLHSMMRVNEEESLKLSSLRDALLSKLIAGEIDVSKVDLTQINSHLAEKSINDIFRCAYQSHLPFTFSAYLTGRKFLVCLREGVLGCEQLLPVFFFMPIGTCLFQR